MNTKQKGSISEIQVLAKLTKLGHTVSQPYGDNARYDFILDINNKLLKLQVKTGHIEDGTVKFQPASHQWNSSINTARYYDDDVDYFVIYVPETEQFYLMKPNCGSSTLRLLPPKNNQIKNIKFAKDFILEAVLEKIGSNGETRTHDPLGVNEVL